MDEVIKVMRISYHKADGAPHILGLFGEVRYNIVSRQYDGASTVPLQNGDIMLIERWTCYCFDPGQERCCCPRQENVQYNGVSISNEMITDKISDLMDVVDNELIVNGVASGSKSQTVMVNDNQNTIYLLIVAQWRNGNTNGDADVDVDVYVMDELY